MTYRERREARVERLRLWADTREERATATLAALEADPRRHDIAFATQPGHVPGRPQMIRAEDRAYESLATARRMDARADSIERQAAHAIYSDDTDAIPRLRDKIAALEAERDRWTAYNSACRKGDPRAARAALTPAQCRDVDTLARVRMLRPNGSVPPFQLSNLGANIRRCRERLAQIGA